MKKFDVEITETLQRKVSVEAASQEDAERMVTQAWNNQDYVLDSGDFTGVDFKTVGEHELAETRTMNVLLVQPNAYPKKISVGMELEDLQAMVGGDIEVTYPFEDEVAIILNESGKINGLPLNRAIYTEDGDIFNTINFRKSMHYNPFAYIHSEKDILKLTTTLIANTKGDGKAGDEFWTKAETLLYCALIGYIHYEAPLEEQNFATLIEFLNAMEVREDDETFQNPVDQMFEALKKKKPNHFAVRQYAKFKLAAGDICSK